MECFGIEKKLLKNQLTRSYQLYVLIKINVTLKIDKNSIINF